MCSPLFDFSCLVALVVLMPREVTSLLNDTWFLSLLHHLQGVWAQNGVNWKKWDSTFQQNMSCCARSLFAARSISLIHFGWSYLGPRGWRQTPQNILQLQKTLQAPDARGFLESANRHRAASKRGYFNVVLDNCMDRQCQVAPQGKAHRAHNCNVKGGCHPRDTQDV